METGPCALLLRLPPTYMNVRPSLGSRTCEPGGLIFWFVIAASLFYCWMAGNGFRYWLGHLCFIADLISGCGWWGAVLLVLFVVRGECGLIVNVLWLCLVNCLSKKGEMVGGDLVK